MLFFDLIWQIFELTNSSSIWRNNKTISKKLRTVLIHTDTQTTVYSSSVVIYSVVQCQWSHSVCVLHPLCSPVWFQRSALLKWSINYRRQNTCSQSVRQTSRAPPTEPKLRPMNMQLISKQSNRMQFHQEAFLSRYSDILPVDQPHSVRSEKQNSLPLDTLNTASFCSWSSGLASHIPAQQQ